MKKITFLLILLTSTFSFSQKSKSTLLGQTTLEELKMSVYEKDSSAVAVVLHDEGNRYYSDAKKRLFTTDYYSRIKIINKNGLEHGTHKFRLYYKNTVKNIEGITYNLGDGDVIEKTVFNQEDLIINEENEYLSEYIINLPNIKSGSVIEFRFSITGESMGISDWYFQDDIPTVKSVFNTMTPKTMDHIVNLIGMRNLTKQDKVEKTKCIPEKKRSPDCEFNSYVMESIPAFEEEVLMPHSTVLVSKLKFRLTYYLERGYRPYKMMTRWTQFDKSLKGYYFDQGMTKERFFKKIIPENLLNNGTQLTKAKNIFHFIQDHYTWNGKETGDTRINIRKNFKNKEASVDLIATTLYNSLKGAGIECYYVAVSTRSKGPVDRLLPNIRDFNYTVVKAVIDGKTYFLDPTNKSIGFGYVQPFASVKDGRVLDYTIVGRAEDYSEIYKGSYWEKMKPQESAAKITTVQLNFSQDDGFSGKMNIKRNGYTGMYYRSNVKEVGMDKYQETLEENFGDFEIVDYKVKNLEDRDQRIEENIDFEINNEDFEETNIIRFKPILFDAFEINPFLSKNRQYPIDFIYPRSQKYRFVFNIPEGYTVTKMPEDIGLKLPDGGGSYLYKIQSDGKKIKIFTTLKIAKTVYNVDQYAYLKKLYDQIVNNEKVFIELKKQ